MDKIIDKTVGKLIYTTSSTPAAPEAKYTRFGERIRQAIPGPVQCSVGCGGRNCKWENPTRWSDEDQVIKGVFSSWVLDDVVAMSRPSTEVIRKYKMIEQFKKHNIRSIINLQRPGEHASCGPPLEKESLFTYRPQEFMDNDIFFYNFGWKDYGVASMDTILDMVKVMSFALEEGKVAVHCHAGLGRTGVLIACYLVYAERMDPAAAILRVRKNRSNSIQTRGQIACINDFWLFLRPLRIVFPQVIPHAKRLTLKQFLSRQRHLLHGFESRELRHLPKLIHEVCQRLSQIAHAETQTDASRSRDVRSAHSTRSNTFDEIKETLPKAFVNDMVLNPSDLTYPALEIYDTSPKNVEKALSLSVINDESVRPMSLLTVGGPRSNPESPSRSLVEETLLSERSSIVSDTSVLRVVETSATENITDKNFETDRSIEAVDVTNNSMEKINETEREEANMENLNEIPDEQIERDVNEILGCNTNNNHSIKGVMSKPVQTGSTLVAVKDPTPANLEKTDEVKNKIVKVNTEPDMIRKPEQTEQQPSLNQPSTSMRKPRLPSGRSETILPTGLPTKNRHTSAKGTRIVTSQESESSDSTTKDTSGKIDQPKEKETQSPLIKVQNKVKSILDSPILQRSKSLFTGSKTADKRKSDISGEESRKSSSETVKQKPMFVVPYFDVVLPTFKIGSSPASTNSSRSPSPRSVADVLSDIVKLTDYPRLCSASSSRASSPSMAVDDEVFITKPSDDVAIPVASSVATSNDLENAGRSSPKIPNRTSPLLEGLEEVLDENLDEIIDIVEEGDKSIHEENLEQIQNIEDETNLSNSMTSRVSWPHNMQEQKNVEKSPTVIRKESASSLSGRRTPLMYRAEKNLELLTSEKATADDVFPPQQTDQVENQPQVDIIPDNDVTDTSNVDVDLPSTEALVKDVDDNKQPDGGLKLNLPPRMATVRSMNDLPSSVNSESPVALPLSRCSSSGDMRHPSHYGRLSAEHINPTNVALALSYKLIDDEWLWEKVYSLQVEINNHKDGWKTLTEVTDPYVLASLMWSWVEHLAEPVLKKRDLHQMMKIINRASPSTHSKHVVVVFDRAIKSLEPGISSTIKCLLAMVTSFPPLPKRISESMVDRLLSALTLLDKAKIDKAVKKIFQKYVDAVYESGNRKRFLDDVRRNSVTSSPTPSPTNHPQTDFGEDIHFTPATFTVDPEIDEILRPSAGSVHSSGSSSATGMTTPRIAVN